MGSYYRYTLRFGGSNPTINETALTLIDKYQEDNAKYSGQGDCDFSNPLEDLASGLKQWDCYCNTSFGNFPNDLLDDLVPLTRGCDFHIWCYSYTDDGCYESSLIKYENGGCTFDGPWDTGILEIDGAIAAARLEEISDVEAALTLIDILHGNCCEGWLEKGDDDDDEVDGDWEEEDLENLYHAHLAATTLANAFQRWPALLCESNIQRRVVELKRNVDRVLDGIQAFNPFEYDEDDEDPLNEFKAVLDAVLKQCTPRKPKRKASAATAHRI
jgi:hypothetical protein